MVAVVVEVRGLRCGVLLVELLVVHFVAHWAAVPGGFRWGLVGGGEEATGISLGEEA